MPFCYCLETLFQEWFIVKGVEPQEKKKQNEQPQEEKSRKEMLRERFIKNKRPLNPTHIYPKKEKELEIRTLKRIVMMFQFDDDEERNFVEEVEKT
jgi:hypothetical protein